MSGKGSRYLLAAGVLLSAMVAWQRPGAAGPSGPVAPPTGAVIEASGFASILSAPYEPYPAEPPASLRHESEPQRLARAARIPVVEAERRMNPDEATMRAAMALRDRLQQQARGNYVDVRIVRDPLPRYLFHFRRDGAATLARFTSDRRFAAADGGVPAAELEPLMHAWLERFRGRRLASMAAIDPFEGRIEIGIGVSRSEYEAIARQEGWRVPPQIRLDFQPEIDPATIVAPDAAPFVRLFPRADRAPGIVLTVARSARIVLRDGCFRMDDSRGGRPLVLFGRNTRLLRDAQGYLAVASLTSPTARGRIGEVMTWGGYPPADESEPDVRALRRHCGSDPIVSVGEPTSSAWFRVRPDAIDAYAVARGVSRRRAWDAIKACWARQDRRRATAGPGAALPPLQCDTPRPPRA